MPFELKNAGDTYQRLVYKVFRDQIRRNLEPYVDDMVIKSTSEEYMLQDIQETFDRFRSVYMKLNPKKCSFCVEEGPFLGHFIKNQGIRANPSKVKAVIDLESPRTLKEIQSLNRKLAALSRFLLKGAEKSLPFFKALNSCMGPSQSGNIIKEVHEGSCGLNKEPRSIVVRVMKLGYYWPLMYRDAAKIIQDYSQCQENSMVTKVPSKDTISSGNTWPFSHLGISILVPLPTAPQNLKFLAIAVEHLTKWVKAKPVTTTIRKQAEKFIWEHVICRLGVPKSITSKYDKQFREDIEDHQISSNPIQALNVDSLKVDLVVIQNTCSEKEDINSVTASSKSVKESSLNSKTKDVLSKEDLKGTRIEHGFKRAFMSLFGQDNDTFTSTMLLNVYQLQKQLDKDEFQEDGSMAIFWVINRQFQKFIDSQFTLDYDSQMIDKYFVRYTRIEVKHFRDTLLQHMGNVKKSVAERTRNQRQYDRRVNKRQLQTPESNINTGKAVDADLVDTESIRTDSIVQDESSKSGNDIDNDDADIRPIYDEEPMAKYPEQCQVKSPMLDSSPDNQTTDYSKQLLEPENILLKKTVA
ncbi:retrovirus-related pol polyprotein from transposon TNT 1-94 [Tanacetum coccineum]